MSTVLVGDQSDDRDPVLGRIPARCAAADGVEVWRLGRAWQGSRDRGELVDAALELAGELGRRPEARRAMARVATGLRASPGGREISVHLTGMDVVFRAQAAAGDAALAVLLREHLSPEVRDALAAPWAVVFGSPFEERVDSAVDGPAHPTAGGPAA